MHQFQREVVNGTARQFVEAKLAERDERHRRSGESRYRVEPNIKDGKGGLRDLHTLHWLAKYLYGNGLSVGAVEAAIFTANEYATFRRCEDFLWMVRCHLHFMAGRAEERLTFDVQPAMAERLGYSRAPGLARGRALHEALLPGGQGGRRPHHHPVLGAGDRAGQALAGPLAACSTRSAGAPAGASASPATSASTTAASTSPIPRSSSATLSTSSASSPGPRRRAPSSIPTPCACCAGRCG